MSAIVLVAGCAAAPAPPQSAVPTPSEWLEAARAGEVEAQYRLGAELASAGERERASAWYCRAALQGHADAQLALADLYAGRHGDAVPDARGASDPMRASLWYSVAILHGRRDAEVLREELESGMSEDQVLSARQHAARWQQRRCAPV